MAEGPDQDEERKRPTPPPVEFLRPGEAQTPPPRDQTPAAWVPRPEDFQRPPAWTPPTAAPGGRSNLPKVAGVLLALAALIGMAGAVYSALNLPSPEEYVNFTQNRSPATVATSQICALLSIWSQAMALLGAILAFQRMNWRLTLACAVLSLGTLGFLGEASLVGSVALVVTFLARRYFLN
jgi:hypothetical protein